MRSIDDIINREFSHSFMGYDMREVDFFLDEIIERFEKLEAERKEMLSAMEYLLKRVEALGGETGENRRLATDQSTFKRLNGAAAQSIVPGPVRVQAGGAPAKQQRPAKSRPRPEPEPQEEGKKEPVQPEAEVAIELETEAFAPDMEELMPELIRDMEAVMDAGNGNASRKRPEDDGEKRDQSAENPSYTGQTP